MLLSKKVNLSLTIKERKMEKRDLSYFRLSLKRFLSENHPERGASDQFIEERAVLAEEVYESSFAESGDVTSSLELANEVLYNGLHFSKVSIIQDIIEKEFFIEVQPDDVDSFSRDVLTSLEEVFGKYDLSDTFDEDPVQYNQLYTELTGAIAIKIGESNGV